MTLVVVVVIYYRTPFITYELNKVLVIVVIMMMEM